MGVGVGVGVGELFKFIKPDDTVTISVESLFRLGDALEEMTQKFERSEQPTEYWARRLEDIKFYRSKLERMVSDYDSEDNKHTRARLFSITESLVKLLATE